MKCYKIKTKNTALYLKGTPLYISYDKIGRIFHSLGKLRTFISLAIKSDHNVKNHVPNWEIVELELTENKVYQVHEIVTPEKIVELLKN